MSRRTVRSGIIVGALVAGAAVLLCATAVLAGDADYRPVSRSRSVAVSDLQWRDEVRGRDLALRIYAPAGDDLLPLILLASDTRASAEDLAWLAGGLARRGYAGALLLRTAADSAAAIVDLPRDLSSALDQLTARDLASPLLAGRVDPHHMGCAGRGLGAFAALALAGQSSRTTEGARTSLRDMRIKAVIALCPPGPGAMGLEAGSWDRVAIPTLTVAAAPASGPMGGRRACAFDLMPGGHKYLLRVRGGEPALGGGPATTDGPAVSLVREWILQTALAFFDFHLRDSRRAETWLETAAIGEATSGDCRLDIH